MASFTLKTPWVFTPGLTVGAYAAANWPQASLPPSGAPIGSPAESQVMGASGCTFVALTAGTEYLFAAQVNGTWRYVHGKASPVAAINAGTLGATWTPSISNRLDNAVTATLGANLTLSPPAAPLPVCYVTLALQQDATGGRTLTLSGIKSAAAAGITLSTAANALDVLVLYTLDGGTTWVCEVSALDVR